MKRLHPGCDYDTATTTQQQDDSTDDGTTTHTATTLMQRLRSNSNSYDNVYGDVIMALPLREFTWHWLCLTAFAMVAGSWVTVNVFLASDLSLDFNQD